MNFKSFIKKKMPVSFIVKRQRWKTLCLLKHEGKGNSDVFHGHMLLLHVQIKFRWKAS